MNLALVDLNSVMKRHNLRNHGAHATVTGHRLLDGLANDRVGQALAPERKLKLHAFEDFGVIIGLFCLRTDLEGVEGDFMLSKVADDIDTGAARDGGQQKFFGAGSVKVSPESAGVHSDFQVSRARIKTIISNVACDAFHA